MHCFYKFIVLTVLLCVLLAGCSGGSSEQQGGQQKEEQAADGSAEPVRLGVARGIPALQFFYMMDEGQLEAEDYNVEWQVFDSPVALGQAFSSGQVDMAVSTGITTAGELADQGVPLVFVANVSYSTVGGIYSEQPLSIPELEGKRIGLLPQGTQTTLMTELLLEERYGLDPEQDFEVTYVDGPQSYLLLSGGDLDASLNFSREAVLLAEEGYNLVFDLNEEWRAQSGTDLWLSAAIADPEFTSSHSEFLQTFRELMLENRDLLVEERRDTLQQLAVRELKLTEEDAQNILPVISQSMQGVGYGSQEQEGVRTILQFIQDNQVIQEIPEPLWWQPYGS